ncbi:MAG: molybdenum cofactor biosynthesis protein MoaE [Thermoanaerobaculia bacterium]|nr:molybdenum cofactor biosynthesis protein MoaE [Thermoanaerobaculia bacterium]
MHLTRRPLDAAAIAGEVAAPGRGAAVLFVGSVRDRHAGRDVVGIDYSGYETMAESTLATIERELAAAAEGLAVRIVHRLGALAAGEASIVIAAAAPRRDAAFAAARRALERVKREAPIWKLERYADGTTAWREEEPLSPPAPSA